MNETPRPKIVITKDELLDASVDEALELQRSYEPAAADAAAPSQPRFRLIYAAWFYLMIAGALGAVAAWALLEPRYSEGIQFTGKVENVDPNGLPGTWRGTLYEIRGGLTVAGVQVFILPEKTRIQAAGSSSRLSLRELSVGEVITVLAQRLGESPYLVAAGIRLEDPRTPAQTNINVASLSFQQLLFGFLLFPIIAGMVGLTIGAVEGIVCRTWARAAWSAAIGLAIGLVGGTLSVMAAGLVYQGLGMLASNSDPETSAPAFLFQMFRRGLGWTIAGMAMGLGQGFALKSSKLKFNGFVGGMVGGLLGGLLFDPIGLLLISHDVIPSAGISRAVGFTVIGGAVGLMIGLTDLLTRDAWLKVLRGPLQGKEFSFSRTPIRVGSSPKNEIYLFKDFKIDPFHAEIRKLRDTYEIVDGGSSTGTWVDGRRVERARLADGARIKIGDSEFSYFTREQKKKAV